MRDMKLIDNELGINLNANGEFKKDKNLVEALNMEIYGETPALDCTASGCYCPDEKMGFMLFGGNQGSRPLHAKSWSELPIWKIKSYATFNAEARVNNIKFADFGPSLQCDSGKK